MAVIKRDFEFSKDRKRKQAFKKKKQFLAGLLIVFAGEKNKKNTQYRSRQIGLRETFVQLINHNGKRKMEANLTTLKVYFSSLYIFLTYFVKMCGEWKCVRA